MVLASLADGPKHGYAIIQDLLGSTGITIGPGTLYAILPRLETHGLIEPLAAQGRRRPYRLTSLGAEALHREATEMQTIARMSLRRLSAHGAVA